MPRSSLPLVSFLAAFTAAACTDLQQAEPSSDADDGDIASTGPTPLTTGATTIGGSAGDGSSSAADVGSSSDGGSTAAVEDTTDGGYATTGSATCGDGVLQDGEVCDGARLRDAECEDLDGFVGGELSCDADCALDTSECWLGSIPGAGELVISEIMQNPAGNTDATDEWFEIHNPTSEPLNLVGCWIEGNMSDMGFEIEGSLPIAASRYIVLSPDTMSGPGIGFEPDYRWPPRAFSLNNNDDEVHIECGGDPIDGVEYDNGMTFPNPNGESMSLATGFLDATSNNDGANWCLGSTPYGPSTNLGTPGEANDPCP